MPDKRAQHLSICVNSIVRGLKTQIKEVAVWYTTLIVHHTASASADLLIVVAHILAGLEWPLNNNSTLSCGNL